VRLVSCYSPLHTLICTTMGLCGKVLAEGYRDGFCEKMLEAPPMYDKANATWLQDGLAAGQG